MSGFLLDAGARTALDVALGAAAAMGDERCGTEHLLFGVIATGRGDIVELAEVFALDTLRLERSIHVLRADHCSSGLSEDREPPLSARARVALEGPTFAAPRPRSSFDLLVGVLTDATSGAATVLRHLGVRIGELRRLVELGAARLGSAEVESLIAALDRRDDQHLPWWGPAVDAPVTRVPLPGGRGVEIGRSRSTIATLDALVAGVNGFGMTLSLSSRRSWVLPPRWELREELIPGVGAAHRLEPDVVVVEIRYPSGTVTSNRRPGPRWTREEPAGALVRLGSRSTVETRNDRRIAERRHETCEWWAWPLPADGDLLVEVSWAAEAVRGSIRIDGTELARRAGELHLAG